MNIFEAYVTKDGCVQLWGSGEQGLLVDFIDSFKEEKSSTINLIGLERCCDTAWFITPGNIHKGTCGWCSRSFSTVPTVRQYQTLEKDWESALTKAFIAENANLFLAEIMGSSLLSELKKLAEMRKEVAMKRPSPFVDLDKSLLIELARIVLIWRTDALEALKT